MNLNLLNGDLASPVTIKSKILLVDDLNENLLALEALLVGPDREIFKVRSGVAALEILVSHEFSVAIIDVKMPGMSGFELAELMRGANHTQFIPILFVTASAKEQSFSFKGYELGAVDYLLKPFDDHVVKSKVKVFIEIDLQKNAVQNAESIFRGLLEAAPDAIVIVNDAGKILLVNEQVENFFGFKRDELIGQAIEVLMPNRFRNQHVNLRTEYSKEPRFKHMGRGLELFGKRKDGSEFPVDISLSPLQTKGGKLISAAIRDISERRALENEQKGLLAALKETQKELEFSVKQRDEFMSIASHELKTPLTSLLLQCQLRKRTLNRLGVGEFGHIKLQEMFECDEKQLKKISGQIENMLDISRISSGKLQVNLERFDLCQLVKDLMERYSELFLASACVVTSELCDSMMVFWDHFRIEQVITNLLTNAMRYGAGKPIFVKVHRLVNTAQITVCDHGQGIALDNQERIFQKFERASSGRDHYGLGLGLYIVKEILDAHLGLIRVESKLGQGATFVVEIPISTELV